MFNRAPLSFKGRQCTDYKVEHTIRIALHALHGMAWYWHSHVINSHGINSHTIRAQILNIPTSRETAVVSNHHSIFIMKQVYLEAWKTSPLLARVHYIVPTLPLLSSALLSLSSSAPSLPPPYPFDSAVSGGITRLCPYDFPCAQWNS